MALTNIRSILFVLSVVLSNLITTTSSILADNAANDDDDDNDEIRCVTDWGIPMASSSSSSSSSSAKMSILPKAYINDGYCDCIYTGFDETHTSACAGIVPVPTVSTTTSTSSSSSNKEILFQCPQQPTLKLHLSRINDGICDCCDGADEVVVDGSSTSATTTSTTSTTTNHCPDNCATVLAAFRAEQKQRQLQFHKGREVRNKMMTSYQTMINTTKTKIKQLSHDSTERKKILQDKYRRSLTVQQQHYTNVHIQRIYNIIYSLTGLPHDRDRYTNHVFAFLHDISITELETLIVYTCQMAGELVMNTDTDSDNDDNDNTPTTLAQKTCVPLRLAAIDIGDMFVMSKEKDPTNAKIELRRLSQDEKYNDETDGIMAVILANIYSYNSQYPQHPIFMEEEYNKYQEQLENGFKKSSSKTKRSSGQHDDDDDDEAYEEEYEEDEYELGHDTTTSTSTKSMYIPNTIYEDRMISEQERSKLETLVHTSVLSQSRQTYIQRVRQLEQIIQNQITTLEKEQSPEPDDEDLVLADEIGPDPIDHSDEIQQLRTILHRLHDRISHIEQGYTYGISAHKLLSSITKDTMTFKFEPDFTFGAPEKNMKPSVNDAKLFHQQYLQKLFLLTLYHSQLSVVQVYEILQFVLSPLTLTGDEDQSNEVQQEQCTLPYAHLCPPISVLKESMLVPKLIYEAMERFCSMISMDNSDSNTSSAETTTCAAVDVIPESIPDGYFGYYPIVRRNDDDVMTTLLNPLGPDAKYCTDDEIRTKREMRSIQETVTQYQINLRSMEQTLEELKQSIQDAAAHMERHDDTNDDDGIIILPKYGLGGELHSIQDQCFDYTQGKYKYEICLYQGSSQKDIENTSGGDGTSLGQWTGTTMERIVENNVEYYERIWKWENGAQCWNGPQRSITAHVNRCGPITRIISANEPDTCRYVVEVESPIACDTIYQQRCGLE